MKNKTIQTFPKQNDSALFLNILIVCKKPFKKRKRKKEDKIACLGPFPMSVL